MDEQKAALELMPWEIDSIQARQALIDVPHWFHTFCLNHSEGIYTPGTSGYNHLGSQRTAAIPQRLDGLRVLDLGTWDGFFAFLAEHRGASRVLAVDNEDYVVWETALGRHAEGGQGIKTIKALIGSSVEYRKLPVEQVTTLAPEEFDLILCFGLLHWLVSPLQHLIDLRALLTTGGTVLVETYGKEGEDSTIKIAQSQAKTGYPAPFLWEFSSAAIATMAQRANFQHAELLQALYLDEHPRLLLRLTA